MSKFNGYDPVPDRDFLGGSGSKVLDKYGNIKNHNSNKKLDVIIAALLLVLIFMMSFLLVIEIDRGSHSIPLPPHEFREQSVSAVGFSDYPDAACKSIGGNYDEEDVIIACQSRIGNTDMMILPNPCQDKYLKESEYANIACHELGHLNGWIHD